MDAQRPFAQRGKLLKDAQWQLRIERAGDADAAGQGRAGVDRNGGPRSSNVVLVKLACGTAPVLPTIREQLDGSPVG